MHVKNLKYVLAGHSNTIWKSKLIESPIIINKNIVLPEKQKFSMVSDYNKEGTYRVVFPEYVLVTFLNDIEDMPKDAEEWTQFNKLLEKKK